METLRPSQVPEYLRTSKFFLELNAEEDDEFSIPTNYMKQNTDVNTLADMTELLNTIRFWGSDFFPGAMVIFAAKQPYQTIKSIVEPYCLELPVLSKVCLIASQETDSRVRLEKAMDSGDIDVVRYFRVRNKTAVPFTPRAIALAAGRGALDCLQYALADQNIHPLSFSNTVYSEAVRNGRMDAILFLHRKLFPLQPSMAHYYDSTGFASAANFVNLAQIAACAGHCDIMIFLHKNGCYIDAATIAAADAGHFDCLMYAMRNGGCLRGENAHIVHTRSLAQRLASTGYWKLFPLAVARGCRVNTDTALLCARSGNLECLKVCMEHGARVSMELVVEAAQKGHLACLQYLQHLCSVKSAATGEGLNWLTYVARRESSTLSSAEVVENAVWAHQWECLRFLIEHGCPLNKWLTTYLVQEHQLELYHLATAHGCGVSLQVASKFAADGNLAELQHALEHGCERSEEIVRAAARHGQLQCLIHAHAQGCPWSVEVTLAAARGGHLKCLKYLHEHGCPWDARVRSAPRKQHILQYADQHNCPL